MKRANHIIESLDKYVTDMDTVKGLGFCVSKEHAHFMAEQFNDAGIASISLVGESKDEERKTAKDRLVKGELRFIFVVDIYNEGVDIPEVNTVLFLRPTESLTIFLQQLGRGLRIAPEKDCLTVLDFIGQANKRYNFEEKFRALLANTKHSVDYELKHGFVSAPKGCYVQFEKKAQEYILDNIRASYSGKRGLISRIESFVEDTGKELTFANFISHYHMDAREIYGKFSFARLMDWAGVREDFNEPAEEVLTKAFSRIVAIDSRRWIEFLLDVLPRLMEVRFAELPAVQLRMMRMFYITVWQKYMADFDNEEALQNLMDLADSPVMLAELIDLLQYRYDQIDLVDEPMDIGFDCPLDVHCTYTARQILTAFDDEKVMSFREGVKWLPTKNTDVFFNMADFDNEEALQNLMDLADSPVMLAELIDLLQYRYDQIDLVDEPMDIGFDCPLDVHCTYTARQILTAFDDEKVMSFREGVKWLPAKNTDVFFITLNKSDKDYSPTGQRYIYHKERGSKVVVCVREFKNYSAGAAPYSLLGLCDFVKYEGSRPMNITWKLERAIPAKYLRKTGKLVV